MNINHIGPAYYSENGSGYDSYFVEEKQDIKWEELIDCTVYIVVLRYSTGDTFSRSENRFKLLYGTSDFEDAKQWVKNHIKELEEYYNGYFDTLEEIECRDVQFVKNKGKCVDKKDWWNY
jgi:hypothetical protein